MEDKIFCCGICLPSIIASDDRAATVRALSMWESAKEENCRCGHRTEFELSR